jgi:RND family efflux transporter MFP subunit
MRRRLAIIGVTLALASGRALAEDAFVVAPAIVGDEKAVFATVESANVVPARVRTGGAVARLMVKYGDQVERGATVASVADDKLILQMKSLDAQIAGLDAQVAQTQTDLARAESLFERGTIPRARLDEARTAFNVATNQQRARTAERAVIEQQLAEGNVLAPTSGRVLKVPVTPGTVVLPGEPVAMIAERDFVLRLRVPERHARFLTVGDPVRIDGADLGKSEVLFGAIKLVYPQIEDGRVVADAIVEGLGDYFVGERVRVWITGGDRTAFIVPARFVTTRFGVDYVRLARAGGEAIDVPVQRGRPLPRPAMPDGLEILSGVHAGDRLVQP